VGLGLSIVRAVARQHGGDICFVNGKAGMQAIISLPKEGCVTAEPARKRRNWRRDAILSANPNPTVAE
jgi:K+-sensing histidine kinase KdpD